MKAFKWFAPFLFLLLIVSSSQANNEATFEEGTLKIPSVYSSGKTGFYQNAVFKLKEDGSWKLESYLQPKTTSVEQVELHLTDSLPGQAFLKVSGYLSDGCASIGRINVSRTNNEFIVNVYVNDNSEGPEGFIILCTQALVEYSRIIQIPIYDLPAGDYSYVLNDEFTGSFSLDLDNQLMQ